MTLVFCDYISHLIKKHLAELDRKDKGLLDTVGSIRFDVNPDGSMRSKTKFISVVDKNGTAYTITIEENREKPSV